MRRGALRLAGHSNHCGRSHPAHIAHVGGAADLQLGFRRNRLFQQARSRHFTVLGIVVLGEQHLGAAVQGLFAGLACRIGQSLFVLFFLRGDLQRHEVHHVLVQHLTQRLVGNIILAGGIPYDLHFRLGHQGSALGDLFHTLVDIQHLVRLRGADEIVQACAGLDHIGRLPAGIHECVVDAGRINDVLTQELHTHVHQLCGIQGTAAHLRGSGSVGGAALEVKVHLRHSQRAIRPQQRSIAGVPGQCCVDAVEHTELCHKGFTVAAFLSRAAKVFDSTPQAALLHVALDTHSTG